jgi:hypothetical protein
MIIEMFIIALVSELLFTLGPDIKDKIKGNVLKTSNEYAYSSYKYNNYKQVINTITLKHYPNGRIEKEEWIEEY